tara:strand:- start:133 stop:315 length:183 start_codon:yes stop_codon:yes gene_type:complete
MTRDQLLTAIDDATGLDEFDLNDRGVSLTARNLARIVDALHGDTDARETLTDATRDALAL